MPETWIHDDQSGRGKSVNFQKEAGLYWKLRFAMPSAPSRSAVAVTQSTASASSTETTGRTPKR